MKTRPLPATAVRSGDLHTHWQLLQRGRDEVGRHSGEYEREAERQVRLVP